MYLCINHAWNNYGPAVPPRFAPIARMAAVLVTFLSVVVAWVFFRADSVSSALYVLSRMADPASIAFGHTEMIQAAFIGLYAGIAWFAPSTQTIMGYDHENRTVGEALRTGRVRPAYLYASAAVLAFGILGIQHYSEFIYFRF
jgi:hypothetical protein